MHGIRRAQPLAMAGVHRLAKVPPGSMASSHPEVPADILGDFRRRRHRRAMLQWGLGVLSVVVVVGGYAVVTHLPGANNVLVPQLGTIGRQLSTSLRNGQLISATGVSLERVAIGYVCGCGLAIIIGSLRGWFSVVGYLLDPIIDALRPVPALAYIPLVILWVGISNSARVLVIGLAAFLSCVVSVSAGMREVPKVYVQAAQTLGASRAHVFWSVAIPASTSYIFAGLRVALGAAWGTLVAAELIAAQNGLGFLLESGQEFFQTPLVMITLVTIGVIGLGMDVILRMLQARIAPWAGGVGQGR